MFEESCIFAETASETIEAPRIPAQCTCTACAKRRMLWAYFTPGDEAFQALAHSGVYRWEPSCRHHEASSRI